MDNETVDAEMKTEKSKDRLVRTLIRAAMILLLSSLIINASMPNPRSFLWFIGLSMGASAALVLLVGLLYWAKPSKQEKNLSALQ